MAMAVLSHDQAAYFARLASHAECCLDELAERLDPTGNVRLSAAAEEGRNLLSAAPGGGFRGVRGTRGAACRDLAGIEQSDWEKGKSDWENGSVVTASRSAYGKGQQQAVRNLLTDWAADQARASYDRVWAERAGCRGQYTIAELPRGGAERACAKGAAGGQGALCEDGRGGPRGEGLAQQRRAVARRLRELLRQFPAAAAAGVPWRTLARVYAEAHQEALDVASLGYGSARAAAQGLLGQDVRLAAPPSAAGEEDEEGPLVALSDAAALAARPGSAVSWPSLYSSLCKLVECCGEPDSGASSEACGAPGRRARGLLLSRVMPCLRGDLPGAPPPEPVARLLLAQLHPVAQPKGAAGDDKGWSFIDDEGGSRRLVKIGQLVQAVLRWRYQRMEWREAHGRDPGALDAAVEPRLELGFCREKNNLLLRLVEGRGGPAECPRYYRERPEADRGGAPRRPPEAPPRPTAPPPSCRGAAAEAAAAEPPRCRGARRGAPEEACAAQRARDELADTAGAADPEGCLAGARGRGRSPSCRGRARSLAGEPEGSVEPFRSRSEPPLGRRVPDLYDDPFEPPPQELWSTHAAAPPVPFASAGYAALAGPGAAAPPPCPLFLGVLVPAALLAAPTPARLAAGTRGDAAACKASSAPASPRPRPVLGAQGAPGARGA